MIWLFVIVTAVVGVWMILSLVGSVDLGQVRKALRTGPYRRAPEMEALPPGPIMCEECGVNPRDRYYPPDINMCRDCFMDGVIRDEGQSASQREPGEA